jgi:coronin-7
MSTKGHEGIRACRLVKVDASHLVSVGFSKSSQREIFLWDKRNFTNPIDQLQLDISPSPLIPHFDEENKLIYLCGRGDASILPIEVSPSQSQPLFPLAKFESPVASIQQGVKFIPKKYLSCRELEVARCWRLTQNTIESIEFSVTRQRKEFFQDDIFSPPRDYESVRMTAIQWQEGSKEILPDRIDLCPSGMVKLSNAPPEVKAAPKYSLPTERELTETERQKKFLDEIFQQAKEDETAGPLKQELMEGVDSDEWDDD